MPAAASSSSSSSSSATTGSKPEKSIPYCTIILVVGALICHALVLLGNIETAKAMSELGESTNGWSEVGIQLATSLSGELDEQLNKVSGILSTSLAAIGGVQMTLDQLLGSTGNATDGVVEEMYSMMYSSAGANSTEIVSLLAVKSAGGPVQTVQAVRDEIDKLKDVDVNGTKLASLMYSYVIAFCKEHNMTVPQPKELKIAILAALDAIIVKIMNVLTDKLLEFWEKMKPALEQVGEWLLSFGDQIQAVMETVSTTMDKAQKMIDSMMSQAAETGIGEEQMFYDTFTLFDASGTGTISKTDLESVAEMYGIDALAGPKATTLHKKYDTDHDGELTEDDYKEFVHDSTMPGAMSVVLRTFAKKLSTISGNVGAARMRDEVARAVMEYLTLISAKNKTKLEWVSNRLTNASVPMEFTADVLKNFALDIDNPDKLTTQDVGQLTVNTMYKLEPEYVKETFELLSNVTFWASEGFDPMDQPIVVERVATWLTNAEKQSGSASSALLQLWNQRKGMHLSRMNSTAHIDQQHFEKVLQILPMKAAQNVKRNSAHYYAEQRQKTAQRLNACYSSGGALKLKSQLLAGTAASVTAEDPLQTQAINSGVPAVPETLEFAKFLSWNASQTSDRFVSQCMDYSGESSGKLDNFADQVKAMVKMVQTFLLQMEKYSTPAGINRTEAMIDGFKETIVNKTTSVMSERIDELLLKYIPDYIPSVETTGKAIDKGVEGIKELAFFENDMNLAPGGDNVQKVLDLLTNLQALLPDVVKNLKNSRRTVSSASATLNSIFSNFQVKGPPIFYQIGEAYQAFWVLYFSLLTVITLSILFYGFYATGWLTCCGGPTAGAQAEAPQYEAPRTCYERLAACCSACGACFTGCKNSHMCFWSILLLMEILALLLFIVAIVLCILSGVKAFMSASCAQVYILGDPQICGGSLDTVNQFLKSFWQDRDITAFPETCSDKNLMVCQIITERLKKSTMGIIIGSVLAAVFSFQMIIESAVMHEHLRWRLLFEEDESKKN
jgi:hypothetical protein